MNSKIVRVKAPLKQHSHYEAIPTTSPFLTMPDQSQLGKGWSSFPIGSSTTLSFLPCPSGERGRNKSPTYLAGKGQATHPPSWWGHHLPIREWGGWVMWLVVQRGRVGFGHVAHGPTLFLPCEQIHTQE